MTKFQLVLSLIGVLSLSSCNLYGGIDSPKDDAQILSRARGCFDRGDYTCAHEYYQKLSASSNDYLLSENAFVTMAETGVFSVSDLVASLGTGRGSGASLTIIAKTIASRGTTGGSYRATLQTLYQNANSITNVSLKAYTRFMLALGMVNQVLANAAGADGIIDQSDFATNVAGCIGSGTCVDPGVAKNSLRDTAVGGDPTTMDSATGWTNGTTGASIEMLVQAATAAEANFNILTGGASSYQGVINALNALKNLPGGAALRRQGLMTILF